MTLLEKIQRNLQLIQGVKNSITPGDPIDIEIVCTSNSLLEETVTMLLEHMAALEAENEEVLTKYDLEKHKKQPDK